MAAYAALVSLKNNMEQIQNHPRLSTSFDEKKMESLFQRVDFLLDFIESYSNSCEAEALERQIASAAHAAEDVLESRIVDQILPPPPDKGSIFIQIVKDIKKMVMNVLKRMQLWKSGLERIMQEMDSISGKIMKIKVERGYDKPELPAAAATAAASSRQIVSSVKSHMVGFEGYLIQLLDQLTGDQSCRQIIPIVGMGGIGKTTLARNAYDSLLVVQHFDVRAWVTVSERYDVREILLETLSCLRNESRDGMYDKAEHELGEVLHKTLSGRRYLIVLDDMWSTEAWDKIKFFFPNNYNRSRIIVTTRMVEVANLFASVGLALDFLGDDLSWELFSDKVFEQEVCPPELEESGKKIVKKCKGLPLAIVVIGGLLRNSPRTQGQWENVEMDITSMLSTAEDSRCLNLFSLSYSHLPACLKPCFLYLGIFPEDYVIRVSRLTKLWVSEGFIKPYDDQRLEEIAEGYIKDLVDRNLISVHSLRWNGKVKTFRVHDLLRDLCIRIAEKEKFLRITSELDTPQEMDQQRRIVIRGSTSEDEWYNYREFDTLKSKPLARSLIFNQGRRWAHVKSRLLRVLVQGICETRDIIFQQVNLRFLVQEYSVWLSYDLNSYSLPCSISSLWNVQTLIMTGVHRVCAPPEIWKMAQLRHLIFNLLRLPEPPPSDGIVLHNLQTLERVENFVFTNKACERMPNIKKLRACFSYFSRDTTNFASFNKLESLHYQFDHELERDNLLQSFKFPNSLKKLTLKRFPLQWKDLSVIGSLPYLEALILENSIKGPNWDPVEGEFLRLRFLRIVDSDLICWNADETHFPVLEKLVLNDLANLNEIPSGIGDIQTLESIYLLNCSVSAAVSAIKILEEQESLGNQGLKLKVDYLHASDMQRFKEQVELEGSTVTGLDFQIGGA